MGNLWLRIVALIAMVCSCFTQDTSLFTNDDKDLMLLISQLRDQVAQMKLENMAIRAENRNLNEHLQEAKQDINALQTRGQSPNVSCTYTRWGRTGCDGPNSKLVYKGYIGSSHYTHSGGGSNYVCLTDTPTWEYASLQTSSSYGTMYGTEYETESSNWPFSFDGALFENDATCAVCEVEGQSSTLMVPGTHRCPQGWNQQYKGYIVAEYHGHADRTEFICLDGEPETVVGGHADTNGALLYLTRAFCGALPCPPYKNNREITCVVCTK